MEATNIKDERLKRLGLLTDTAPHVVFISRGEDMFNVVEHYPSPRRKPYKRYTLHSPGDYMPHGGEVVIIDDLED